jgi:hypothetical protein
MWFYVAGYLAFALMAWSSTCAGMWYTFKWKFRIYLHKLIRAGPLISRLLYTLAKFSIITY